ncbi:histone acetyltransferase KAT6A isoform X2 [Amborella trichopoda]|uniref:histone acetyltransferase KAT6A isoform X2 n=1 Tax=Amborella trichopoda TaxID=13333 RepID=UPI0009C0A2E8|nr:histone acetyltransferase KAT6A isoform X2 [Amborella trichopoda]|eukprot:XP_020521699.1 histone acetyltransferase KAT6A isoform X2 [Amborella trichopoda]
MHCTITADSPLDYAAFQFSPKRTSYEAYVFGEGKSEKLAEGPFGPLAAHLPAVKEQIEGSENVIRLQLPESLSGASWFTKCTLYRFLHIVGKPEVLRKAGAIENEMAQLEEARRFHLSLYAKGGQDHASNGATVNAARNELLRAMDVRLLTLRGELIDAFNLAAGTACSFGQIAHLVEFAQHFGATDLRNSFLKYLALSENNQAGDSEKNDTLSVMEKSDIHATNEFEQRSFGSLAPAGKLQEGEMYPRCGVSPAKIAEVERKSPTESEESSNSSEEERSPVERSRPMIRSASPRRSASPMRRIQIGRSGSRRSTALTIKSLSYFPTKERISVSRETGDASGDEEAADQPIKKPDNLVRRMSVQDAINLFESKQRDLSSDIQKRRASTETGGTSLSANKAVLRRWSAGMGDSATQCETSNQEVFSTTQEVKNDLEEQKETGAPTDFEVVFNPGKQDMVKATETVSDFTVQNNVSDAGDSPKPQDALTQKTDSAEWNRQKEAELNQMLMKMMGSRPMGHQNQIGTNRNQDLLGEQNRGFYDHYKEKRDERLRGENAGKRAEREAKFRAMQEALEQRKAEMASKSTGPSAKTGTPTYATKSQRNSSPSMQQPKREVSKPGPIKKASPRASPVTSTRGATQQLASPRTIAPNKTSTTSATTPTRRKNQSTPPSVAKPGRKIEREPQPTKAVVARKEAQTDSTKRGLKSKMEKEKPSGVRKSVHGVIAAKASPDSATAQAKPSFYSKVTKKSSVVPLESKPFLRKGAGIGPGISKTKGSTQTDDLSKSPETPAQPQVTTVPTIDQVEAPLLPDPGEAQARTLPPEPILPPNEPDPMPELEPEPEPEKPLNSSHNFEKLAISDHYSSVTKNKGGEAVQSVEEITPYKADEDVAAALWAEPEPEPPVACDTSPKVMANRGAFGPAISSPRVRHSLSQMLRADSGEADLISEWGNAENPPAIVYQKDAPKGLKRLLKFARKSRNESIASGLASPSVGSEGEDDGEEAKGVGKRHLDAMALRKSAVQGRGFGFDKAVFNESFDSGSSSKRSVDYRGAHDLMQAQTHMGSFAGQNSSLNQTTASTKGSRSFFSLSTFRSKGSEAKTR